ncbi:MAG: matrixin family metalloprotease [Nanoarchaeota archaeon]|nr:matrixin family metalloprotease [Nanoarchaeota archaeon]
MRYTNAFVFVAVAMVLLYGCVPAVDETNSQENKTDPTIVPEPATPIPDNTTIYFCKDYCSFVQGGENDKLEYNQSDKSFFCTCSDYSGELAAKTEITPRDLKLYGQKKVWWENMPITYQIMNEDECGDYEVGQINRALEKIEEAADGIVKFAEVDQDANIELSCEFIKDCYSKKIDIRKEEGIIYESEEICSHAAGTAQITKLEGFKIKKAKVTLIGLDGFSETSGNGASGFYIGSCGHTTVEVHEILHTFGFGHTNNSQSVMYHQTELVPYTIQKEGACIGSDRIIDQEIIDELLFVYG